MALVTLCRACLLCPWVAGDLLGVSVALAVADLLGALHTVALETADLLGALQTV